MARKPTTDERLEELEKKMFKIELGSRWLKCICYVLGSMILVGAGLVSMIKDWPFR